MQRRDRFLSPVGSSFWTFSSSPHTFNPLPSNSLLPSTLLNWATHSEPLLLHPSPSISTLSHISRWSRAGTGSPPHRDCTTAMSNFWRKISLRGFFFPPKRKFRTISCSRRPCLWFPYEIRQHQAELAWTTDFQLQGQNLSSWIETKKVF